MKKIILPILICIFNISLFAKDISGIKIQDNISLKNTTLNLNGAGVRSMFFIDLYVGALYLKKSSKDAKKIISDKTPMDIRMVITSSLITPSKMKSGFSDDFKKLEDIGYKINEKSLQKFLSSFNKEINKKDIFDFLFLPPKNIYIYKNAKLITQIDDFEFKKALFGVWLSKKPAQKSLKDKMLGN